jgi:hypothetical protein
VRCTSETAKKQRKKGTVKWLILVLTLIAALIPCLALAGGPAPSSCPAGRFCQSHLGLSLRLPPGWYVATNLKVLPGSNQVAFAAGRPRGLSYNLRLIIQAYAITSLTDSRQSVRHVAAKLIHAERVTMVQERPVHYAGSYGLLIRGFPSGGTPALNILLGRHHDVYQIIAPGSTLAADQRAALQSLQFIPIHGPFLGAHG